MFLAFSGISVLMQVIGVISPCGLSVVPYVKGKLLQAALAFVFTWVFLGLFPTAIPTFALDITLITIPTPRELLVTAFMSILWSVVALMILTAAAWYCDRHEK